MAEKLSLKIKLSYGVAAIGDACSYTFLGTFLMFFLTTIAGLNPVTAGTIAAIGSIWDAVCSPMIGFISDNGKSKHGRRIPFMFFAAFPLGIACAMLFSSIDAGYGIRVIYYGAMVIIFWTSFSAFFIPYMALGAEVTNDYDERTSLRSTAYGFNLLGMVMGMVLPTIIVDFLMNADMSVEGAWQGAGIIVGLSAAASILFTCFVINRGSENRNKNENEEVKIIVQSDSQKSADFQPENNKIKKKLKEKKNILKEYFEVLKLRPILYIIGASISFLIANALSTSDRMYFMTYNLHLEADKITGIMLFCILSGVLFIPIVIGASKRFDKRLVLLFGLAIGAAGSIIGNIIGVQTVLGMCIFLLIFNFANSAYWQLMPAMIYDVCEVDELVYGSRREGTVISLQALAEAVASAIGMQLLGIILGWAGFNGEAAVQSASAVLWVGNSLMFIPAIFMIISMIMVILYPITKKRFNKILEALEKRKNGQKVDLNEMKYLL